MGGGTIRYSSPHSKNWGRVPPSIPPRIDALVWRDLLLNVEEKECELCFSDIFFFASVLKVVPCGTISMELEFLHEPEKNGLLSKFPKANTCSGILNLPTVHTQYVDFKSDFQFAVRNAKGSGIP